MSGFILEYGTENGMHVTVYPSGQVEFYPINSMEPDVFENLAVFDTVHPAIVLEMVRNKVLKPRS